MQALPIVVEDDYLIQSVVEEALGDGGFEAATLHRAKKQLPS